MRLDSSGAQLRQVDLKRNWNVLVLESDDISVTLLPGKGCDIYSWMDRRTGTDVLFKTPWGLPTPGPSMWPADSFSAWLDRYPGGWQVLCPNGGAPAMVRGVERGFHGEASMVAWDVEDQGIDRYVASAVFSTHLSRAPLQLQRRITVEGSVLRLEESVTNTSPDPLEIMWSHHPAFGPPFLEGGCILSTGGRVLTADDEAPGTLLAPDSRHQWPIATSREGAELDLSVMPGPDEQRANLAYLSEFDEGWFAITNPRLELGIGLRWPLDVFAQAWFWQEVHSTAGYPWWRQVYVCAVEPATTVPGQGVNGAIRKGGTLLHLEGLESREVTLEAVMFRGSGPVARIGPGGTVEM